MCVCVCVSERGLPADKVADDVGMADENLVAVLLL